MSKQSQSDKYQELHALFTTGELVGLASKVNIDALERFLSRQNPEFNYIKESKAVLAFAKLIQNRE
jgi:hypothetical protein